MDGVNGKRPQRACYRPATPTPLLSSTSNASRLDNQQLFHEFALDMLLFCILRGVQRRVGSDYLLQKLTLKMVLILRRTETECVKYVRKCLPIAKKNQFKLRKNLPLLLWLSKKNGKRMTFSGGRDVTGGKVNKLRKAIKVFI